LSLLERIAVRIENMSPWILACLFSFLFILIRYPGIITFQSFPMAGESWELQDPVISSMTLVPGERVLHYEIFHNANLLWSNLRGMGEPLLGGEVQAAPLFPLTLLWVGLADHSFFSAMVLSRLFLIGVAGFMIGWRLFGFRIFGSVVFCCAFSFGFNTLGWMNHPWQNALLAVLWYFYFVWSLATRSAQPLSKRFWPLTGVALCFYSLFASGFPEGIAYSALLVICALIGPTISIIFRKGSNWRTFIKDCAIAHILGTLFILPQILALTEYVAQTQPRFRSGLGLVQYDSVWVFLDWIVRVGNASPSGLTNHIFGLTIVCLFLVGFGCFLGNLFDQERRRNITAMQYFAIAPGAFFVLKCFPVSSVFNNVIGNLPILNQAVFCVFFFPLFLWTIAYFAGSGAEAIRDAKATRLTILVALILTGFLAFLAEYRSRPEVQSFQPLLFALVLMTLFAAFWKGEARRLTRLPVVAIAILIVLEGIVDRPNRFVNYRSDVYRTVFGGASPGGKMLKLLESHNIPAWEMRENNANGDHVHRGIATVDLGATAILPDRLQLLRTGLFETDWSGYMPLKSAKYPYSWQAVSMTMRLETPDAVRSLLSDPEQRIEALGPVDERILIRDRNALPRAYMTRSCIPVPDQNSALAAMQSPGYRLGLAVIEKMNSSELAACSFVGNSQGITDLPSGSFSQVQITEDRGRMLRLDEVNGPGVLVLNDLYYPGWKAFDRVSGQEIPIKQTNVAFRGLVLSEPRGYTIDFRYEPWWLVPCETGIVASFGTWLFLGIFAYIDHRKRGSNVSPATHLQRDERIS
jgi:hypothetical protein